VNLKKVLENGGVFLNQEKIKKLESYSEMLLEWNSTHNLTGAKTKEEIYQNILDSIYPMNFVKEPKELLDIGSGAGFPALALGVVWQNAQIVLAEPRNKRASFLRFVILELGLSNISVKKMRVENIFGLKFDLITSRAVNQVETLLQISKHLSKKESQYLLFKGERVEDELRDLKLNYKIVEREKRKYLLILGQEGF